MSSWQLMPLVDKHMATVTNVQTVETIILNA